MVHRTTCKVAIDEMANHENRIVRARWRPGEHVALLSGIAFTAIDRKGLLQEITGIVSEQMNLNMRAITLEAVEGIVRGIIMLYVLDLDNLNQLIQQHADSAVAYAARANLERQMKQDEVALYDWQKAEELAPKDPTYVVSHVDLLLVLERRKEARRVLDAAVKRGIPRGLLTEWYEKTNR